MIVTFTATPNTADMVLLFSNDPLTTSGAPVFTTKLYHGDTLLGTYTAPPSSVGGRYFFIPTFASPAANPSASSTKPVTIQFSSINNGVGAGRLVTTVSGGSVSGFNTANIVLYDAISSNNGYRPLGDITKTSIGLQSKPVLPHLAAGDSWITGIFVINTSAEAAGYEIAFRDDDGNPVVLPFNIGPIKLGLSEPNHALSRITIESGGCSRPEQARRPGALGRCR